MDESEGVPLNVSVKSLDVCREKGSPGGCPIDFSNLGLNQFSVEFAADEVFWMKSDSSIIYANRSACQKLEYELEELIGKRVWEWDPLFPKEVWPTFLLEIVEKGSVVFESRQQTKSGRIFPVEIKGHYVEHEGEGLLFAYVTDISERVEKSAALESYQRDLEKLVAERTQEIERFAYRTSHDLKAPLVVAQRLANFIAADIDQGKLDVAKKNAGRIADQMSRLAALVTDMLDLIQADLKKGTPQELEFDSIIEEVKAGCLLHDCPDCSLRFEIKLESPVSFERARIVQILKNLVSNGIKYRDREKSDCFVETSIGLEDGHLLMVVEDNGVGIPESLQSRAFEKFERLHSHLATGSGLGLSIVAEHVEKLAGTIVLWSVEKSGSRFTVRLPLQGDAHDSR